MMCVGAESFPRKCLKRLELKSVPESLIMFSSCYVLIFISFTCVAQFGIFVIFVECKPIYAPFD